MATFSSSHYISTTCSSNYCFTMTLLSIKLVNADENKDENGSFVDCITLQVSALLKDKHSAYNIAEECTITFKLLGKVKCELHKCF